MLLLKFLAVKIASLNPLLSLILIAFIFISKMSKENKVLLFFCLIAFTDDRGILNSNGDVELIHGLYHSKWLLYTTLLLLCISVVVNSKRVKLNGTVLRFTSTQIFVLVLGLVGLVLYGDRYYYGLLHDLSYIIFPVIILVFLLVWGVDNLSEDFFDKIIVLIGFEVIFYFFLYVFGIGYERGGLVLVSLDTGKKLFPIYFVVLLSKSLSFVDLKKRFMVSLVALMALLVNLSFASRSSLVALLLFVGIELFINRKVMKSLRSLIFLIGFVFVLFTFYGDVFSFVVWKLTSFSFTEAGSSLSGVIRFISFRNIVEESSVLQLFLGKGFGSYFTDLNFPFLFDLKDKSAFPMEEIQTRRFHKPHTLPLFMFLKVGIAGAFLYSYSFIRIYFKNIGRFVGPSKTFLMALFILAINIYSTKLQFLAGFIIYFIIKLNVVDRKREFQL